MTDAWLLDTYPVADKMVSWIKNENAIYRIEDDWTPSIYVACDDRSKLSSLASNKKISKYIKDSNVVERFEKVTDLKKSQVLQIKITDSTNILQLGKAIEFLKFGRYRLYNVDVPPPQSYFYEHDIFPVGKCRFSKNGWMVNDSVEQADYDLPNLKIVNISVNPRKQGKLPKFTDKIGSITVNNIRLEDSEEDTILDFVREMQCQDPDIILTEEGDTFDFPYLIHRAEQNGISDKLVLGRENITLTGPKNKGTSYFSYGRIYFKPSSIKLLGRIHIDKSSCFIWNNDLDIHGLYEIARICRLPLQTTARASIGKCMSSLQFYNATKRGLLIPWKPTMAEAFKTRKELLISDRGGLIFESEVGAFEKVVEVDFASLFGNIMYKENISAETILCNCCLNSDHRVPELNYHICKRRGIVSDSLRMLLQKRNLYSELLRKSKNKIYEARTLALKWILVTSFGYLGFNNAKFGRIDAHIAVCAFARKILLQAVRISERHGFRVLHGIGDSLWLYKNDATTKECQLLKEAIEKETGFELSLDIYKWITFVQSKKNETIPIANRYFGAMESEKLKIRGIELRRHDIPIFFKRCQLDILQLFATANSIEQVKNLLPEAVHIYKKYLKLLEEYKIPHEELSFTCRVSKEFEEYKVNTIQTDAMFQLKEERESIRAGQKLQYIITDYNRKIKRTVPLDMSSGTIYDVKRYSKLLADCCLSVTKPFGLLSLNTHKHQKS